MHLHCGGSYGYPTCCADNRLKNVHFPSMQHHPAKFDHFRRQIGKTLEHLTHQQIQAGDKQLARHVNPRSHHKLFPRCYYEALQLFLPSLRIPQPVSDLRSKKNMGKWNVCPLFSRADTIYSLSVMAKGTINPIWWPSKGNWFEK